MSVWIPINYVAEGKHPGNGFYKLFAYMYGVAEYDVGKNRFKVHNDMVNYSDLEEFFRYCNNYQSTDNEEKITRQTISKTFKAMMNQGFFTYEDNYYIIEPRPKNRKGKYALIDELELLPLLLTLTEHQLEIFLYLLWGWQYSTETEHVNYGTYSLAGIERFTGINKRYVSKDLVYLAKAGHLTFGRGSETVSKTSRKGHTNPYNIFTGITTRSFQMDGDEACEIVGIAPALDPEYLALLEGNLEIVPEPSDQEEDEPIPATIPAETPKVAPKPAPQPTPTPAQSYPKLTLIRNDDMGNKLRIDAYCQSNCNGKQYSESQLRSMGVDIVMR